MGFVFTGRMGTGLVVARLPDGRWSAPSAIGTAGVGWGPQIGGEITDFVIILNTQRAVEAFCASGQVNLGAELGISAGPVGRVAAGALEASASMDVAPCYSYSHSKGLYAGISLEGSVILSRSDVNRSFYGKAVTVAELLGGIEPPPVAAAPLYEAIRSAMERSVAVGIAPVLLMADVLYCGPIIVRRTAPTALHAAHRPLPSSTTPLHLMSDLPRFLPSRPPFLSPRPFRRGARCSLMPP
jgi:lipid-binding SYLF domain-containing protein